MSDDIKKGPYYEKVEELISEDLKRSVRDSRLVDVSDIRDLCEEMQQALAPLYKSRDGRVKRFATMLNAAYTQQSNVFIITQDYLEALMEKDPQQTLKSCDWTSYKTMLKFIFTNGYITELRKAVKRSKGVSGQAGLYELSHKLFLAPLVNQIGADICKANKAATLKWFDKVIEENIETLEVDEEISPEMLELYNKTKEIVDERNKNRH